MRLLSSRTGEMQEFFSEDSFPPYAILSHNWGSEEVTYQQWANMSSDIKKKTGYSKIEYCLKQAKRDSLEWIWVDTCCIDKTSSAELSEAINAMFHWYANAAVCYVYLSDVQWCSDRIQQKARLSVSRWFTRGWTLQELIAPTNVVFYSVEWQEIGTKSQFCSQISSITGIEEHILNGGDLEDVCVAKKMSWASNRKTTRTEDTAYCLLGLFNINMPLIYGEGRKAFLRLQYEILRSSTDQSLFAWGEIVKKLPGNVDDDEIIGLKEIDWVPPEGRKPLSGLLAESPSLFKSCGQYSRLHSSSSFLYYHKKVSLPTLLDNGIMVSFHFQRVGQSNLAAQHWDHPQITQIRAQKVATLFCHNTPDERYAVGLPLRDWGDEMWARTQELVLIDLQRIVDINNLDTMHIKALQHIELVHGDIIFRRYLLQFANVVYYAPGVRWRVGSYVIQTNGRPEGALWTAACNNGAESFAIVLRRVKVEGTSMGALCVSVTRIIAEESWGLEDKGNPEWITGAEALFTLPTYHHKMAVPSDSCILKLENLPRVFVKVQRMPLGNRHSAFVDVIDLYVPKDKTLVSRMASNWKQRI